MMKLYDRSKHSINKTRDVAHLRSSKAKDVVRSTSKTAGKTTQDSLASAKDTAQLAYAEVQKSVKLGWNKVRVGLMVGAALAGAFLQKNMRKAQKKLKKAQKNLQDVRGPLQTNVRSGLTKTVEVVSTGTVKAGQSLQQATTRAKESWQEQYVQRQRKRRRARRLFRSGVLIGAVLALLYTPVTGSEVRQRIAKQWQQSRGYFRNMIQNIICLIRVFR